MNGALSLDDLVNASKAFEAIESVPDTLVMSPQQCALLTEALNDGSLPSITDLVITDKETIARIREPIQYISIRFTVDLSPAAAELAMEEADPLMDRYC
jgi:hypothetical protein